MPQRAVVLLSGGLDSATVLAIAKNRGRECYALSFRYGQRHENELISANHQAKSAGCSHLVIDLPLAKFGGSALTTELPVPHHRSQKQVGDGIPITYVPARNTIFLAMALGYAEVTQAEEIWIGVNALDYSGYPDCRPEFIKAFQSVAALGTKIGVEGKPCQIVAPLQDMDKATIIRTGTGLGVDYSLTWSCYDPPSSEQACGTCDACYLRRKGFQQAGLTDPLPYLE